jgi:hypothetical protein
MFRFTHLSKDHPLKLLQRDVPASEYDGVVYCDGRELVKESALLERHVALFYRFDLKRIFSGKFCDHRTDISSAAARRIIEI